MFKMDTLHNELLEQSFDILPHSRCGPEKEEEKSECFHISQLGMAEINKRCNSRNLSKIETLRAILLSIAK